MVLLKELFRVLVIDSRKTMVLLFLFLLLGFRLKGRLQETGLPERVEPEANEEGLYGTYEIEEPSKDSDGNLINDESGFPRQEKVELLEIFKEEKWPVLFWFIDEYVSCVQGRTRFDYEVAECTKNTKATPTGFGKLFTISDLVFCLVSVENSSQVWEQIVDCMAKGEKVPDKNNTAKIKGKFTGDRGNSSTVLKNEYRKKRQLTAQSLRRLPNREKFFSEMYGYLKHNAKERNTKKSEDEKTEKPKKEEQIDYDEEEDWTAFGGCNFDPSRVVGDIIAL